MGGNLSNVEKNRHKSGCSSLIKGKCGCIDSMLCCSIVSRRDCSKDEKESASGVSALAFAWDLRLTVHSIT